MSNINYPYKYRIILPDYDNYLRKYQGRMEIFEHETWACSDRQALSHILAPRRLNFLFADLYLRALDKYDDATKIELIDTTKIQEMEEVSKPETKKLSIGIRKEQEQMELNLDVKPAKLSKYYYDGSCFGGID